jgi:GT2 family glycosyltransferase
LLVSEPMPRARCSFETLHCWNEEEHFVNGSDPVIESETKNDRRVAVAIVSYGRQDDVLRCIEALAASDFNYYDVVIVENAGAAAFDRLAATLGARWTENTASEPDRLPLRGPRADESWLRGWRAMLPGGQPIVVLEASDNLGYGGGINVAIRYAEVTDRYRGVCVLNPDTEADPRALGVLVRYAEDGNYGLVGCRLILIGRHCVQMRAGGAWRYFMGRGLSFGYGEAIDAPADVAAIERRLQWISGAALYATADYVRSVGLMSEKFFLYCEDLEWSLRRGAFRLGYAHDAIIYHAHGTTIGSAAKLRDRSRLSIYLEERNGILLSREQFAAAFPLIAAVKLLLTLDYLMRGSWPVFLVALDGWWAGMRGKSGRP